MATSDRVITQVDVAQTFETTIVYRRLTAAPMRFITIPARALQDRDLLKEEQRLLTNLEFHPYDRLKSDSDLTRALNRLLREAPGSSGTEFERFADILAHEPLIPFEESPLDLVSLADTLRTASGLGIGAYIGVVAGGGTPLLLITVPAGMIIGGAAAGVSKALEAGLYARVLRLFGEKPRTKSP